MTNITIQNPNNLPLIDYRKCKPLQGDLKDLSEANYKKLKGVLEKRGFDVPLFLWKSGEDYFLMDGHQRQRVMTREDMQPYEVPYILIDAKDEKEAKSKLLEITSQYGTITQEGFDAFIAELDEAEVLEAVHFDALSFGGKEETDVEEDEPPEVDDKEPPKSKLGEIYQLGRHRVMCGDSTKDLGSLLNGQEPGMVFTDPPYGVDYQSRVDEERRKGWGKIENDDLQGEELQDFITGVLDQTDNPRYVCCNWQSYSDFEKALGKPNSLIVWDKGSIGLGAGYRNQHEFVLFYGKLDHNSESNVWTIFRDSTGGYTHPTQKPVEIPARAIRNSSDKGRIVLDYFGGSGSTLVACEQLDRTCYMMELDPKYCDVIRKRYWKLTHDGNEEGWEEGTPVIGKETVVENAVS